jgi:hypothetical protein
MRITQQNTGKTLTDKHFRDWENLTFGYGYGSGEEPIMGALKTFFDSLKDARSYDHEMLEKALGGATAWLLINALCRADILEYGTSPRYGWLTEKGELLERYFRQKTVEDVLDVLFRERDEWHDHCTKQYCNCGKEQVMRKCENPLF